MTKEEAWLRSRRPGLIVWNPDCSVNIELSLSAVMDEGDD